jgi:hypothetical protein
MTFLEKVPLKDGDKFIADLMRESFRHKNLGKQDYICEKKIIKNQSIKNPNHMFGR